ncbi:MAG: MFS transporter [Deltaproteobacteria bacterium]|nr:MFS transporter [Deltaproteobacteria bacterium]
MDKERLWTKDFILIALTNFLIYMVFYLLMATIAAYTVVKFHASTGVAGLVSGIFIIGILIGRLLTGRIVEDIGSRKILIAGTLFFIITSASYFAAVNLVLLIIIRFFHGAAYGVASTATGTIVAQLIPEKRRGEGIGYYSMSQILATALGPLVGIMLSQRVDFSIIFLISSLIAAIGFGISIIISQPVRKPSTQGPALSSKGFHLSSFLESTAIPISIIILIAGFIYSAVLTFLSLYSMELHLEKAAIFFFVVYAVMVILSRPFSGRLLDKKGANFVVYPCLFLFAIGMYLLGQTNNGTTLLLAGAIIGLGYGNFLSCGQAISIKGAPSNRLGLATATYYMFLDVGFGIGPYIFGSLVPFTGYRGLYLMMAAVVLATIVLYYFLYRKKTRVGGERS